MIKLTATGDVVATGKPCLVCLMDNVAIKHRATETNAGIDRNSHIGERRTSAVHGAVFPDDRTVEVESAATAQTRTAVNNNAALDGGVVINREAAAGSIADCTVIQPQFAGRVVTQASAHG